MTTFSVTLTKTKETKNTVRYDDPTPQEDARNLDCLYVKKRAFPNGIYPNTITVTVS